MWPVKLSISERRIHAVFWAYVAAEAFPRYRFSKEKSLLVTTIAGGLLAVANLATYVISVVE